MRKKKISAGKIIVYAVLLLLLVMALYPLLWMVMSSFKTRIDFVSNRFGLPKRVTFENYVTAFLKMDFVLYFANSGIVSAISLIIMIGFAAMTAYAFTRYHLKAGNAMLLYFTVGQMISAHVVLVAVYMLMLRLKLTDNLVGTALVYAASGLPFAIFLLQSYFQSVPAELYDAAEIDGYNEWQIFSRIALPLSLPGISTAFIIQFMYVWNEFPLAMVLLNRPEHYTLSLAIFRVVNDMYFTNYALSCAALTLTALPILVIYALFQKQITAGMTAGALKG